MTDYAANQIGARHSYDRDTLDEDRTNDGPFALFGRWLADAVAAEQKEPNAMTLATVDADGAPAARIVLLRGWDQTGFVFFTNYVSAKGRDIETNPRAALTFFWDKLERQVRVAGSVAKLSPAASDAYFATRPRGSQISAWASPQSQVIPDRATLEARMAETEARFAGHDVARPPHWGGYRVAPDTIEFWQGRPNRAHDRILFRRNAHDDFERSRLGP